MMQPRQLAHDFYYTNSVNQLTTQRKFNGIGIITILHYPTGNIQWLQGFHFVHAFYLVFHYGSVDSIYVARDSRQQHCI